MRIGHHIALTTLAAAIGGLVASAVLWHNYDGFQRDAEEAAHNLLVLRDADNLRGTQEVFLRHADLVYFMSDGMTPAQADLLAKQTWAHWSFLQASFARLSESSGLSSVDAEILTVRAACLDICRTIGALQDLLVDDGGTALAPEERSAEVSQLSARLYEENQRLDAMSGRIGSNLESIVRLRAEGLEARRKELEQRVLLTLGGYLAASFLLWLWSSRRIASPLSRLSRAAVDASRGGTDFRFDGPTDLTEVRTLADSVASFVRKLEGNRDQLEDEVARRTEELLRANRAKSEFLAHMSHELRTPMAAILGFGELLQTENPSQEQLDEYSDSILRNARHLLALLNDILDLSKIEAGQMTLERVAFQPRELVAEVHGLLAARAMEKGIDFLVDVDETVPHLISSDPTRLRQILINLCGNAIKFTAEGSVQLTVGHEPGPAGKPGRLVCRMVDSGVGIPADKLDSIFEAFAQADSSTTRRFGGTGLGLAISRRLARILGGDLRVESREGLGSTFELEIAAEVVQSLPSPEPSPPLLGGALERGGLPTRFRGRVLVVDDVPVNRRLMMIQLQRLGLEVETASDGVRAVDAILDAIAGERAFDVVLMDMQMPELDGYEATRKLRQAGVEAPIYALTAHAMSGDRERCLSAGCDSYLTKPVDRNALIRALSEVLPADDAADRAA